MKYVGKQVQNLIEAALDKSPGLQEELMSSLGKEAALSTNSVTCIDDVRCRLRDLLVRNRYEEMEDTCDISPVNTDDYQTVVRGHLLHYWAQCVDDPGVNVTRWLFEGAPAGLNADTSDLDGVCPVVEDESEVSCMDLHTDFDNFANYSGVEENEEAYKALESYADKGYLKKFETLEQLESHLGEKPILSKIGCIVKQKTNLITGLTTTKTRIILDCKRSMVSRAAGRTRKSILPRVTDAVQASWATQADCKATRHSRFWSLMS